MEGKFYYAEVIAPGAGLVDYDADGDLDVLLGAGLSTLGSRLWEGRSRFAAAGCFETT